MSHWYRFLSCYEIRPVFQLGISIKLIFFFKNFILIYKDSLQYYLPICAYIPSTVHSLLTLTLKFLLRFSSLLCALLVPTISLFSCIRSSICKQLRILQLIKMPQARSCSLCGFTVRQNEEKPEVDKS